MSRVERICATCAGRVRVFAGRYREFLMDPGTLVTLVSGALLVAAVIQSPAGLVSTRPGGGSGAPLYLASALVGSLFIWWSAFEGIRKGDFTADIPVSVATAAALAIGQYSAAAVVAVLLLFGGMMEDFVAARAGKAIEALAKLLPDRLLIGRDGRQMEIGLDELRPGDVLVVRSGERIAADGHVVEGAASVNQAAITGESVPVEKSAGDQVYAGSLNEVGALHVRATKVGAETTLGQIRRMVEEAQTRKAPIERLLNRYAKLYTPAALLLGAGLWWWTGDIQRAITVLIVFCPCVMVLATPTALVASIGNAALRGSLVKKGATIEALAKVDTAVFDKTGTLTTGKPCVASIVALGMMDETELLRLAAIAEKRSEHPLGQAIVSEAQDRSLVVPDPDDFAPLPGLGVRAFADGRPLVLGRSRLLAEHGIPLRAEGERLAAELSAPGRTVIAIGLAGELAGFVALEDALRPEAAVAVARLREGGLRTAMITGDNRVTAERIAAEVGITEVYADVLPQQKVDLVRRLQTEGRTVAFVGDGVNDGPALAAADVGVAMGLAGTDVAIETAEIALLSDDLTKLPHLQRLARQAIQAIRQNLVFSLGVLLSAVGLTIAGVLHPVTGALLHELSSIPVIANSARLIGLKEERRQAPALISAQRVQGS